MLENTGQKTLINTDNTETKHNTRMQTMQNSKTKLPWFSRLLWHLASKI